MVRRGAFLNFSPLFVLLAFQIIYQGQGQGQHEGETEHKTTSKTC